MLIENFLTNVYFLKGIYFGKPRGFGTNENGEEIGYNTEVYAAYEVGFW